MYRLYYMPGACSLAIHALLCELKQPVEIISRDSVTDYKAITPTNQVPVLVDGDLTLREGIAIALHLLEKHKSKSLPVDANARADFYQWLSFASATLHPTYSVMFFAAKALQGDAGKQEVLEKASARATSLWKIVDEHLGKQPFFGGEQPNVIDFFLAVYSTWGNVLSVEIELGENVQRMISGVQAYPAFQQAVAAEEAQQES